MASFLEWYVLERPLAGIGLTPVACAIEEGAALPADERRALAALATSHRSVFELFETTDEMLDIEDLIGGARFAVRERRKPLGMAAGDLFEARLVLGRRDGRVRARRSCFIRPTRARSCSSGSSARSRPASRARRSCSTCRASTSAGTGTGTSGRPRSIGMPEATAGRPAAAARCAQVALAAVVLVGPGVTSWARTST